MEKGKGYTNLVESVEDLRSLIGYPGEAVNRKVITYLDHHCQEFLSKSPFLTISTSDSEGYCDVSPRGDAAGFVHVENEKLLFIPERPGNRRVDTLQNILSNPKAGLLFLIPGLGETLRINGKAFLIKDENLLEKMAFKGKKPLLAIGVEVEECFIHCAKAFKRSGLWEPDSWSEKESLPKPAAILTSHINMPNVEQDAVEKDLEASYKYGLY